MRDQHMKKTFPLHVSGKADARVLDAIKHDVRKYVKREINKPLPAGLARWRFDCRVGENPDSAGTTSLKQVPAAIDAVAKAGGGGVYVEIIAAPDEADTSRGSA